MVIARGPKPLATPSSQAGESNIPSNSTADDSSQQNSKSAGAGAAHGKANGEKEGTPKAQPPERSDKKKPSLTSSMHMPHLGASGAHGKSRSPTVVQQSPVVAQFCGQLRIEPGKITTMAYGHSGKAKLLKYDLQNLILYGGVLTLFSKGTVLTMDGGCIKVITFTLLVAACSALGITYVSDPETLDASGLEELSGYLNGFVPFVLGLYISLTISRWWALRVDALGKVFDALPNVLMLVSCFLRGKEFKPIQEQILRYGMLSIMLTIKAAREYYSIEDLEAKGLMTNAERLSLEPIAPFQRAMVTWSWIMAVADDAFMKAGAQPAKMTAVLKKCLAARDGIQTIHTYLHTQLPFAYRDWLTC
jgi:hypothetical protein